METFIGQIALFPYGYAPQGWAACEGQLLQVNQNPALYALLGANFGGDARTTFGLPDLRGKAPIPKTAYYIALNGIFPQRD